MVNFITFLVTFIASFIGAISGIGGGLIIKPFLDILQILSVEALHFLSGLTVFSMATFSLFFSRKIKLNFKITLFLSIGSVLGGLLGSWGFKQLLVIWPLNTVAIGQAILLLVINILVLIYILNRQKIKTLNLSHPLFSILIGLFLGAISTFLGIGGGPLNIVVLYFFYSFSTKQTVINSLFIIFLSQLTSLLLVLSLQTVPEFQLSVLILMVFGGISGALVGRKISSYMSEYTVERFFKFVLCFIILLNFVNVLQRAFF